MAACWGVTMVAQMAHRLVASTDDQKAERSASQMAAAWDDRMAVHWEHDWAERSVLTLVARWGLQLADVMVDRSAALKVCCWAAR